MGARKDQEQVEADPRHRQIRGRATCSKHGGGRVHHLTVMELRRQFSTCTVWPWFRECLHLRCPSIAFPFSSLFGISLEFSLLCCSMCYLNTAPIMEPFCSGYCLPNCR